jgi:hypothetical protein
VPTGSVKVAPSALSCGPTRTSLSVNFALLSSLAGAVLGAGTMKKPSMVPPSSKAMRACRAMRSNGIGTRTT